MPPPTRRPFASVEDNNRLNVRADALERKQRLASQEDVVIEDPRRLFIRSSGGDYFKLTVGDDGALSTENMGSNPF